MPVPAATGIATSHCIGRANERRRISRPSSAILTRPGCLTSRVRWNVPFVHPYTSKPPAVPGAMSPVGSSPVTSLSTRSGFATFQTA